MKVTDSSSNSHHATEKTPAGIADHHVGDQTIQNVPPAASETPTVVGLSEHSYGTEQSNATGGHGVVNKPHDNPVITKGTTIAPKITPCHQNFIRSSISPHHQADDAKQYSVKPVEFRFISLKSTHYNDKELWGTFRLLVLRDDTSGQIYIPPTELIPSTDSGMGSTVMGELYMTPKKGRSKRKATTDGNNDDGNDDDTNCNKVSFFPTLLLELL
jgi:hypothetical protein